MAWRHAYADLLPADYLDALSVDDSENRWRERLAGGDVHLLQARHAGRVLGFIAVGASRDEDAPDDRAEIRAFYIAPDHWSTGVGRRLWLAAQRHIRSRGYTAISLWAIADNRRGRRFYERAGFVAEPASRQSFTLGDTRLEEIRYHRPIAD
ncbi:MULTISPECIES: GNAT family N-acetyltransferase [unclassified Modicisalibacter]|uniref:GNAT family N-acetyltransferase n=1 Tax=unclassified Modicisalibacter TaxID=2679913 RepID=UPI001CC96789|nr:GNAT family N-acetyltransferase [Modicisalibacter sp. R2A 31.J]MBZ9575711.1 GNAT family N-acetyltransferase [Modicisalibacter sp. MOD 31.J]